MKDIFYMVLGLLICIIGIILPTQLIPEPRTPIMKFVVALLMSQSAIGFVIALYSSVRIYFGLVKGAISMKGVLYALCGVFGSILGMVAPIPPDQPALITLLFKLLYVFLTIGAVFSILHGGILIVLNILEYGSVKSQRSAASTRGIVFNEFIDKYTDKLLPLYKIEYAKYEDLSSENVFGLKYMIHKERALDSFIKNNGYSEGKRINTPGRAYDFSFNLQNEETRNYESPEERNEFIIKVSESMKMLNCRYYYTLLSDYDEETVDKLLSLLKQQPKVIEVKNTEYKLHHAIELNADGTYDYICTIENLNDLLLERLLRNGIDYYIKKACIDGQCSQGVDDENKSTTSHRYTFLSLIEVYATIHSVNISIEKFIEKETITLKNYVREKVTREIIKEDILHVDNNRPKERN